MRVFEGSKTMPKGTTCKPLRTCAAALFLAMLAAIGPATAQFPPSADDQQDNPPLAGTPKAKKGAPPPTAGPDRRYGPRAQPSADLHDQALCRRRAVI